MSTDDVISRFTPAGALDPTFGGAGTGTAAVAFTGSNGAPVMSAFEGATPAADVARKSRQAASIATDLEQLLAERRARGAKHAKEPAEARDRDATLVNQLLREIRAAGVYAFRDDPARQALLPQRGRRAEAGASEAEDGGGRERRDGACKRRRGPQLTRF